MLRFILVLQLLALSFYSVQSDPCDEGYHYVNDPNTGTVGCIPNVCACAGGTPRSGENCTVHEAKQCVCTSAEYSVLDGNDITCETKQCTCPGGTSARGDNCPENGFEHCVSCNGNRKLSVNNRCDECQPGYYMDNNACVENQCTCSNGVGNTGVACATDGTQSCASCNTGSSQDVEAIAWEQSLKYTPEVFL